nr:transposase [Bacillus cereus]
MANHIPIQARIIGANEHESHYIFDILYNNTINTNPTIHSTDTHGTNEINFAILDLFGYQFAPRYKDIYGRYEFSKSPTVVNIEETFEIINGNDILTNLIQEDSLEE